MEYTEVAKDVLSLSQKVNLLVHLLKGWPVDDLIDKYSNAEVVALQKFVWDKTIEIGLRLRGKDLDRKEITERMIPTPIYQRQQGCSERVYYCKGVLCIHSNPNCARTKIKGHVQVMIEVIQNWLSGKQTLEGKNTKTEVEKQIFTENKQR